MVGRMSFWHAMPRHELVALCNCRHVGDSLNWTPGPKGLTVSTSLSINSLLQLVTMHATCTQLHGTNQSCSQLNKVHATLHATCTLHPNPTYVPHASLHVSHCGHKISRWCQNLYPLFYHPSDRRINIAPLDLKTVPKPLPLQFYNSCGGSTYDLESCATEGNHKLFSSDDHTYYHLALKILFKFICSGWVIPCSDSLTACSDGPYKL